MEPPSKKQKCGQAWKDEYSSLFKGVVKSDKGIMMAFCETCKSHFSIKASGRYDINKHFKTQKHVSAERASGSSGSLMSFVAKTSEDFSVIRAEVAFTKFLVEKNIPLAVADDAGELFRTMFPRCEEAKNYKCARTKTTAIVHVLAEHEKNETVQNVVRGGVFSLSTDGGNDTKQKLFPILVRYADFKKEKIVTEIVSVDVLDSSTATGQDIYLHIKKEVGSVGLDLANCISFSADNAAVMVGEKSGVASFLHKDNENISVIGCPCHRLNLAALKAANTLPHKLDQLLIDIYFFLDKSSKRVARLKELQNILGCETHEILKHVHTRWLSLGPCVSRLLEQWEPLSALFLELSEDSASKTTQSKAKNVLKKLLSSEVKAYALFVENVVPVFEKANALLQGDEPLIQRVRSVLISVIKNLSLRFVKPAAMIHDDLLELDILDKSNLLPRSEIDVGFKCRKMIEKDFTEEEKDQFYKSVVIYLQAAIGYLQKKCHLDNQTLINASVADPAMKITSSVSALIYFADRFQSMLPANRDRDECMDLLIREFRDWQASDYNLEKEESADQYWFRMLKEVDQCGEKRFSLLSGCMLGILSIFHSNAACERLFSLVRRNRTDFRHSMSNKLVESLAIFKNKWDSKSSFKETLPKELLLKAKSATAAALART